MAVQLQIMETAIKIISFNSEPFRRECLISSLELPEGLDLYFLPSHSPELYAKRYPLGQPAERLWPLTNEVLANDSPHGLKEVEELLIVRCRKLLQHPSINRP